MKELGGSPLAGVGTFTLDEKLGALASVVDDRLSARAICNS